MKADIKLVDYHLQKAFKKAPRAMIAAIRPKLERGGQEVAREARSNAAKAFSTLTNAIQVRMVSDTEVHVIAGTDYARAVEEGTGPGGAPSFQSLLDWIKVKGITPNDPKMDTKDLAFLIGRKIRGTGTPARPFMSPALETKTSRLNQLLNQGVYNGLKAAGFV